MHKQISIPPREFEAQIAHLEQQLELARRPAAPKQAVPAAQLVSDPTVPDPFVGPPPPGTDAPPLPPATPDSSTTAGAAPEQPKGVPRRVVGRQDSYSDWVDQFRMRAYEAQLIESRIVFGLVMLIVLCGLGFSGYHLYWTQHLLHRRRGKDAPAPDAPAGHSLKVGKDGLELSSPVLGLMVLGLSVLFLFLYLRFVYPINVVSG